MEPLASETGQPGRHRLHQEGKSGQVRVTLKGRRSCHTQRSVPTVAKPASLENSLKFLILTVAILFLPSFLLFSPQTFYHNFSTSITYIHWQQDRMSNVPVCWWQARRDLPLGGGVCLGSNMSPRSGSRWAPGSTLLEKPGEDANICISFKVPLSPQGIWELCSGHLAFAGIFFIIVKSHNRKW